MRPEQSRVLRALLALGLVELVACGGVTALETDGPPDADGWQKKISDTEIGEPLIVEPRGLPPDASSWTQDFAHDEGTRPFLPTWLTREEVEQVDRQIERLHEEPGGLTWQAILGVMRSTGLPTRLVFWTDQS